VVRTYTPVVAGASTMRYSVFLTFSVIGSIAWAIGLPPIGFWLDAIPFVEDHLDLMIVVIACASVVPVIASAAGGAMDAQATWGGRRRVHRLGHVAAWAVGPSADEL